MAGTWADLFASLNAEPGLNLFSNQRGPYAPIPQFNFGSTRSQPFNFSGYESGEGVAPFDFTTLNIQRNNKGGLLDTLASAYAKLYAKKPAPAQPGYQSSTGNADGSGSGTETEQGVPTRQAVVAPTTPVDASSHQSFVNTLLPVAKAYEASTGIPADAWLAMAASESNWGNAPGNELFGIKGPGALLPTWEYENGQRVNTSDSFRTYASPAAAFQDFWDFLHQNSRYAPALQAFTKSGNADWQGLLRGINQAGYATNPNWWSSIINIKNNSIDPLIGG